MNTGFSSRYSFLLWGYLLLSILHIYGTAIENITLIYFTKPLLLTVLSIWFWLNTKATATSFSRLILAGLIFSIGGDSFLMFTDKGPNFFIFGLGSFLIAQLSYMVAYIKYSSQKNGYIKRSPWVLIIFLAVFGAIISFLWSGIPAELKIPVTIYSLAIVSMAAAAFNLNGLIAKKTFLFLFGGIVLFIISDSMIAINKFNPQGISILNGRVWIMLTYLLAQYFIGTRGIVINSTNQT